CRKARWFSMLFPRNTLRTTRSTLACLSLENDAGDRVMLGMAESNQGRSDAALCSKLLRWSGTDKKRLAAVFFPTVDVAPAHCFANTSAERFCHCLLASETRSQMARREFPRHGVFNLAVCENAMQETVSETID